MTEIDALSNIEAGKKALFSDEKVLVWYHNPGA